MANNKGSSYKGYGQAYTKEQDEWLINNIDSYTYPELTRLFNKKFNRNIRNVSDHCIKTLKLHKKKNSGNFKKGRKDFINRSRIGCEVVTQRGEVYVKISDEYIEGITPSPASNPNFKLKKEIIWESIYGNKPEGYVIVFLDTNKQNFNIENLYCIPRKIALMLGKNKWWTEDRDLTLAAIKWCELYYAIRR